jgi:DNA-binding NtrC family response regulator
MGVTAAAERLLQQAPWPGNVRELRNVVERLCMVSDGGILTDRDLRNAMSGNTTRPDVGSGSLRVLPGSQTSDSRLLATTHRAHIERILREAHGNKTAAAHMLGISRRSLYRWLDRLQLAS